MLLNLITMTDNQYDPNFDLHLKKQKLCWGSLGNIALFHKKIFFDMVVQQHILVILTPSMLCIKQVYETKEFQNESSSDENRNSEGRNADLTLRLNCN